jgi:hypothetical protein
MVVGLASAALGYGLWLRRFRSERYEAIARALESGTSETAADGSSSGKF